MDSLKSTNGRVDILTKKEAPDISNLFAMYDKIPANQCTTFREPTLGQWDESALSKAYFSQNNIQIVQNGIRAGVYKKLNGQYTVSPQDCDDCDDGGRYYLDREASHWQECCLG